METYKRIHWLRILLCLLGIGVAGYLTWVYVRGAEPYCGGASGCSDVQHSPYAQVMGVPVPLIGVVGYVVLLVLTLLRGQLNRTYDFYLPIVNFGVTLVGLLYSIYLTYLEAFVLYAWCYWCLISAVTMVVIWLLSALELRQAWVEA